VRRKAGWAWRYSKDLNKQVNINNNQIEHTVEFGDKRITEKWFDAMTHIDNKYE